MNWEAEHYNSVLEITVSFLGIFKWEQDICKGFSPALHLQCRDYERQFSAHFLDWAACAEMNLPPPLTFPFLLWWFSKRP
jgi:hypothetical protein